MIDIHSHILPGIDDGARTLEQSLALCRMAAEDGIEATVCTPHVDFRYTNRRSTIEGPFEALRSAVEAEGIPLRLVRGAEVHMSPDILVRVRERDLMTYADQGKYLLLEFPFQDVITGAEEIVYRIRLAGLTPVIAHPERIGYFMEDPDRLLMMVRQGALGQVTAGSLVGRFGEKSRRVATEMVERHLAHCIASDAHDLSYRQPVLAEAAREVARIYGEERRQALFVDNPRAVIEGGDIDPPEPLEAQRRAGGWFSFLSRRRRGAGVF